MEAYVFDPPPQEGAPGAKAERHSRRVRWRVFWLGFAFLGAWGWVGHGIYDAAVGKGAQGAPTPLRAGVTFPARPEILDRDGRLLAGNMAVHSLYARPDEVRAPARTARQLAEIFPDLRADAVEALLQRKSPFVWLRRTLSPRERMKVLEIGEPGLHIGRARARFYPAGRAFAHILGGVRIEDQATDSLCYRGLPGGIEAWLDAQSPGCHAAAAGNTSGGAAGGPIRLSVSLPLQAVMRAELQKARERLGANWATALLMNAENGEILASISLPDFDPNRSFATMKVEEDLPPSVALERHPRTDHAIGARAEFGSIMKLFTAAAALEAGLVTHAQRFDTQSLVRIGSKRILDRHPRKRHVTLGEAIAYSSNNALAQIALLLGPERQEAFLARIGFTEPVTGKAVRSAPPATPYPWTQISAITVSYGHGIEITPLHLAAATAVLVNGGWRVRPSLLRLPEARARERRLISGEISALMRGYMRDVVTKGTGYRAAVPGYPAGGKTGTADKARPDGGYFETRVRAAFVAAFPIDAPRYVLVVLFDEPERRAGGKTYRTADRTAAPAVAALITRFAPLLGLMPSATPALAAKETQKFAAGRKVNPPSNGRN